MKWELIFCAGYIVPPCKGLSDDKINRAVRGSVIAVEDLPQDYFIPLFRESVNYPVGIVFTPEDGEQRNEVRKFVRMLAFGDRHTREQSARYLACRLASATDNRSPTGLFMVLVGQAEKRVRVILWKLPANEIIQAAVSNEGIRIQVLEDAFLRDSTYFKAAVYEDTAGDRGFWTGKVEDKQAKWGITGVSDYWIRAFLKSVPQLTDIEGSRQLGRILRELIKKTSSLKDQETLVDAAHLIKSHHGTIITLRDFARRFLPDHLQRGFESLVKAKGLIDIPFRIDRPVLDRELRLKSLTIDDQFTVRGPLDVFEDYVQVKDLPENKVEIRLAGTITEERIHAR